MDWWKHFRDRIGADRTVRTDVDTDPGEEPAERTAARPTGNTLEDLATAVTSASHAAR